jgi:hypothetical protein
MYFRVVLLYVIVTSYVHSAIIILQPESLKGITLRSPTIGVGPREFNITGRLVLGDPFSGCGEYSNKEDIKNNIVLIHEGKWQFSCQLTRIEIIVIHKIKHVMPRGKELAV